MSLHILPTQRLVFIAGQRARSPDRSPCWWRNGQNCITVNRGWLKVSGWRELERGGANLKQDCVASDVDFDARLRWKAVVSSAVQEIVCLLVMVVGEKNGWIYTRWIGLVGWRNRYRRAKGFVVWPALMLGHSSVWLWFPCLEGSRSCRVGCGACLGCEIGNWLGRHSDSTRLTWILGAALFRINWIRCKWHPDLSVSTYTHLDSEY